jgi:hypothetical protein
MSRRPTGARTVPPAARVFSNLQADEALLPSEASALRKSSALFLALLVLGAVPLFWAANAAGVIGDVPAAIAKGSNSGPDGDDDSSGPGSGDDDDDRNPLATDDTSANGHSTRGTTNDNDTRTRLGTDDTSRNGHSTRGTTRDNDTRTNSNTHTRTHGQTQTRTRTRTGGS